MKRFSMATIPYSICFAVVNATTTLFGLVTPAMAQTAPAPTLPVTLDQSSLARIAADLVYPNSAQRFFETGNAQFEQEIRSLSEQDDQPKPLLTVKPEVLEQFEEK